MTKPFSFSTNTVRTVLRGSVLGTAAFGLLLSSGALAQQRQSSEACDPVRQNCVDTNESAPKTKLERKLERKAEKKAAKKERKKANNEGSGEAEIKTVPGEPIIVETPKAAEPSEPVKRKKPEKPVKAAEESAPAPSEPVVEEPVIKDAETKPPAKTPDQPKVKKAERKDKKKGDRENAAAPTPSADAPKPKEVAEETVEKQIKQAEEEAVAVVPENITKTQKQAIKKADKKRRDKARDRREELIGAAAVGVAVGVLAPLLGGTVVEDQGDRFVVERDGNYYVRKDESSLFRDNAKNVEIERLRGGRTRETVFRRDGSMVITVRDAGGYVLRREKVTPSGRSIVLYDARDDRPRRRVDFDRDLPPVRIGIPRDEYIVSGSRYDRRSLAEIFAAPVVQELPAKYTLREVRESERLRSYVRRVDIDTLTFDSDSAYVSQSQVEYLADVAGGMLDVIDEDPSAVFLVEGHTDAVGGEVYNLTLSDRRADTVARILVEAYGVPAENLVVQGYGEQFLKIDTPYDERQNRRVTVRNISPLLETAQN